MTCVVALTNGTDVWMGGDAAGIDDDHAYDIRSTPKVFRRYSESKNTQWLFGFSGNFRIGQLIEHSLVLPDPPNLHPKALKGFVIREVVKRLRDCLSENKALISKGGAVTMDDTMILIGVAGFIFLIEPEFQVVCSRKPYEAIGGAATVAKGSMYTSGKVDPGLDPRSRIKIALAAAKQHNAAVQEPFTIVSTKTK